MRSCHWRMMGWLFTEYDYCNAINSQMLYITVIKKRGNYFLKTVGLFLNHYHQKDALSTSSVIPSMGDHKCVSWVFRSDELRRRIKIGICLLLVTERYSGPTR